MIDSIQRVKRNTPKGARFSILIPTWNNLEYLQLCIRSIRENSDHPHQIIVLVNEGSDGTVDWLRTQEDIDHIHSPKNIGICFGLNVCRGLIETNDILYLNDDMYVLPGWDTALLEEAHRIGHRSYMLSATMVEPHETGNACVVVRNYGDSISNFKEGELLNSHSELEKEDWMGSTWPPNLIPLELWDLVGGMSIEFSPGMYSDPDLSRKMIEAGVRLFKGIGSSKVYHFGSKSTGRIKKNKGRDTFLLKWGVSSNHFIRAVLKRGEPFKGPLKDLALRPNLADRIKRLIAAWKN